MLILFVAGTLGGGGAEKQLYLIATGLHELGYEVAVFSFSKNEIYEQKLLRAGVPVYHSERNNYLSRLYSLTRLICSTSPKNMMCFHFYANWYVSIIGKLTRINTIGSLRGNGIHELSSNGFFKSALSYYLPDALVANSDIGLKNLQNKIGKRDKVFVLSNIVETNTQRIKKSSEKRQKKICLLFVGRLHSDKQPLLFLNLIQILEQKASGSFTGIILGDGPLKDEIESTISQYQLPVIMPGFSDNVSSYLTKADYLISTSLYEGTPNVMLEAMISGVPIKAIENNCYDHWKSLQLISCYSDIDALADSLESGLREGYTDEQTVINSLRYVETYHSKNAVLSSFLRILNEHL